jgi:hypothetical protein
MLRFARLSCGSFDVGSTLTYDGGVKWCERSIGTVFQLPNPDAIYSQDEGKERR